MKQIFGIAGMILITMTLSLAGCQKSPEEPAIQAPEPVAPAAETAIPEAAMPLQSTVPEATGETLFKDHCKVCHPDGGNVINPEKTLEKAVLEANGIITVQDIVALMRNPGPGMSKFDETMISKEDALKIAEYIQNTFH